MECLDAIQLYNELNSLYGDNTKINIHGDPVIFSSGIYEHADNNLITWGYEGENDLWQNINILVQRINATFRQYHAPALNIVTLRRIK
jgi:hypothetical protein